MTSFHSVELCSKAMDQINYSEFNATFNMTYTLNNWFLVTELHIWMLMIRAMAEKRKKEEIRGFIVETFYRRCHNLIRKPHFFRYSYNENFNIQWKQPFQYAVLVYDLGLIENDMRLACALWERFFKRNCDDYVNIELLVTYVRMNVRYIV